MTINTAPASFDPDKPRKSMDDYKRQPYLTIEDVAGILHRTVNGARKMRSCGSLPPARRVGNRLYWHTEKFFNWIEQQKEPDDYDYGQFSDGRR